MGVLPCPQTTEYFMINSYMGGRGAPVTEIYSLIYIETKMVPDLGERGISRHENIPYAHHTVAPSKMWGDLQLYKGPTEFQVCSSSACHLIPLADKSSLCGFAWETDHRRPPESPQKGQHWPISLTRGLQPHWSIGVVLSQYLTH